MVVWELLSGWKMVLGYLLINVPFFIDHPALQKAIEDVAANPSMSHVIAMIANILLVTGLVDRIRKNVTGKK